MSIVKSVSGFLAPSNTFDLSRKQQGMKCAWGGETLLATRVKAGTVYRGFHSHYKGPGALLMDGPGRDARVHRRGGIIWEQNVKAGPRVAIYPPTSGSTDGIRHSTDEVTLTAFLPSSPKGVHPFLSAGMLRWWIRWNNSGVTFFQPGRLPLVF